MAVKPIYAVGLDAGSRQTRMVVVVLEGGRLRFLGCGTAASQGWLKGRIADQRAVADSILAALREAEARPASPSIARWWGLGGPTVRGANSRGVVELGYVREIEQRDINRVVDRASRVQLPEDRMVLQLFPQDFVVDDHPGHRDPRRMLAARLEINVHLVTASVQEHNALVGAVNQAHLAVEETVFEALAACYAGGAAGGAAGRHRGGGYRRAIHRAGGLLRRRHAPGLHRADLRRPFHARPGAGPVPEFRGCRTGEAGIRRRGLGAPAPKMCWWSCPRPKPRASRGAAPVHQRDSGSARRGAVPLRARRNWPAWAWSAR